MLKFCATIKPDFLAVEKYLQESFAEGRISNGGPCTYQFSQRLRRYFGLNNLYEVIPVSSGHTALMAAYAALDIKRPLMPAYTFQSTFCAASLMGIQPKLVDVDLLTGCLEVDQIKDIPVEDYDSVVAVCGLSSIPRLKELEQFCR